MPILWQDLKYGLRMLAKNPGFTAVAVLTLALGIGANTVIFSVINGLFLHPAGIADPAHVFAIRVKYQKLNLPSIVISAPDFADVRDSRQIFSSTAAEEIGASVHRAIAHRVIGLFGGCGIERLQAKLKSGLWIPRICLLNPEFRH
jgi:hypothetical protein